MNRPFPFLRSDLQITGRSDGNFLVTDPVTGQYFLFSQIEISLARWLRNADSIAQWCDGWNLENRTQQLTPAAAESFLVRLMNDQLVALPSNAEGDRLHLLQQRTSSECWSARLKNPLAIRLPGIDPTLWLRDVVPLFGWLFRPATMIVSLLLLFSLAMLVLFAGVRQSPDLPSVTWLLSPSGIAGMLLVFIGVKVVHELGHAIAAMAHGASCKQIGVMFLFFMPTLYCDVSAAWRLESRTKRIAISAAGVYVELMIGLLAAIGWALSGPGIVNAVLFQLMALCGIGTVLINGNPLMRYDGYYVLSDLLNRPNLSLAARHELGRFGKTIFTSSWMSHDWTLIVYAALASIYRWLVLSAIVIAIICFTNENSILVVGWLLAGGLLLMIGRGIIKWFFGIFSGRIVSDMALAVGFLRASLTHPRPAANAKAAQFSWLAIKFPKVPIKSNLKSGQHSMNTSDAFAALRSKAALTVVVGGLVWFVCCVPLPRWVYVDVQVQPVKSQTLFATSNGFVDAARISDGDVTVDQVILTLNNPELSHQYLAAEIEAKRAASQIEQLQRQARQIPELHETLAAVIEQGKSKQVRLEQLKSQLQALELVSSMEGRVESLLVQRNPGNEKTVQQVRTGQPIARVIDDSNKQVRLLVDEHTIDLLEPGQAIRCCFDRLPNRIQAGTVGEVLVGDWEDSLTISLDKKSDGHERDSAVSKRYLVSVKTVSLPKELGVFSGGRARVKISPTTLLSRLNQQLQHTFQFR